MRNKTLIYEIIFVKKKNDFMVNMGSLLLIDGMYSYLQILASNWLDFFTNWFLYSETWKQDIGKQLKYMVTTTFIKGKRGKEESIAIDNRALRKVLCYIIKK